ncbi:MAG: enoyl-CoA hydratase/isomerase family protein [Deltaproteobacteria bacterium]|nr:enoyl-CoA hydratase/isomerase family protein [Deltaproteobacteria bacterium]MCB9487383.1 enoyl-CoA hydratase/isomerase family protein [Deltaproteobacteria bacterium]
MSAQPILITHLDDHGVATLTMNRPQVSNAFNDELIAELTAELEMLGGDPNARVVFLTGSGKHFSAGADLNWMRRMATYTKEENLADSMKLSKLMHTLHTLPKPTVALVNGAAIGGGAGLVACCDIAVASTSAVFALSEVNLGLIPAVVGPYVVQAIGVRQAQRYFLSGERLSAEEAFRFGFVHELVAPEDMNEMKALLTKTLLRGGPKAQAMGKALVRDVAKRPTDQSLRDELAEMIADLRASDEAQEGMSAFLEKRSPSWRGAAEE